MYKITQVDFLPTERLKQHIEYVESTGYQYISSAQNYHIFRARQIPKPKTKNQQLNDSIDIIKTACKFILDRPNNCDGCAVLTMLSDILTKLKTIT